MITYRTALEIVTHEAVVRQAYKDSVGVWTWSVGLTSASGHDVERYIGKLQSMEHCLAVFVWALRNYARDVEEAFSGHVLKEHQFAAALSFHWNTGAIKSASWVKRWKAGDPVGARKSFMDWRKPPEIIPRRQKERDLFFDGKWSQTGEVTEWPVKAGGKIDWGSPQRVDITEALRIAMGEPPRQPDDPGPEFPEPPKRKPWFKTFLGCK